MTIANTNNLGRAITSLPRTCSHFLVGFCSTVSNHRAKILPADFPLFGPSQQGELMVKLKRVPKLSWLYPQKESWNNQYTSRDTNKVRVLNTCGSCPRVPQIKITASEEVTATETCSERELGSKAVALQEQ